MMTLLGLLVVVVLGAGALLLGGPASLAGILGDDDDGGRGRGASGSAGPADQSVPGTVLLVPGYGGSTSGVQVLAGALERAGRQVQVVAAVGDGTGDLADQADALQRAATEALEAGAPSVDVVGYSAGGVVARLWLAGDGADEPVRRVVTLGSPHQGTDLARFAAVNAPQDCPEACQQLSPGSSLLRTLPEIPGDGTRWTSVWSTSDQVVVPPADASSLRGAVGIELQRVCSGARVDHGGLVRDPLAVGVVDAALDGAVLEGAPSSSDCDALTTRGRALLTQ
ncbi:Triacylglycerol esterase/lipase EstA, alpha/beta hydrolase fold [Quadrisphaera granulorum]|uniref:Triacylglycerol esterase/lipase EstA (Alpha/beta hydrolase family) n=2 Tax=Quadrisphaera granulorum TaxID=317664 RepID=A0A315ZZU8_9ACTN|nr:triacylglycerol esterase/lipase EstA (alpha/beta hydrolase family) [Quadrisphaera granulorum]SZE97836.1 Triacylglycerol esterase/lipase EstA, alpha/beta hydrolase fold [Quadrisphaera granulorum]